MTRTALFSRNQPGGVFTIDDLREHPGDIYFVDSGSGTDGSGYGKNPDSPFATVDYAIGQCTANQGDVIYVLPGHTETVDAAAAIDIDVAGIKIVGLGEGFTRPTFDFDADTSTIEVAAANCTIENCIFTASSADVAKAIDVNAVGFTIKDCLFLEDTTDEAFTVCILGATSNTSDYITVSNCKFICPDASASSCIQLVGGQGHEVRDCVFMGDWSAGAIDLDNTPTYVLLLRNLIYNADDTADNLVNASATATGICAYNGGGNADTQANQFTATAMAVVENYGGVISEDLSAILDPIAT